MKIDITTLREAANKFATTLDAHRANPRDALVVTEWDEATSALTDIVGGDENNIIVVLFDMLEAERQRANESGERFYKAVQYGAKLEAELAALRGEQDPVGFFRKMPDGTYHQLSKSTAVMDMVPLFTSQPKPVVVLPSLNEERFHRYDEWHDITVFDEDVYVPEVIAILEAAGIVVKDGE